MRIAIDGRTIVGSRSGVGTYAERTVRALLKIDPHNEYVLFLVEPNPEIDAPNLRKIVIEGYDRMVLNRWWENILLPRYAEQYSIDVYFSPSYALPILPTFGKLLKPIPLPRSWKALFNTNKRPRYVVTIHDVIASVLPETFTPKMRMWQYLFNSNAARVADRIITDSESTKRDFLKAFGGKEEKISVVYLSVDERFKRVTDERLLQEVRQRYSLPEKFILYVGTIEPRKNVGGLTKAYSLLPQNLRECYPLVIGGARGWYADEILRDIHDHGVSESITFTGYVEAQHLPALYSLSSLFVFPSLYEGFGYPPLEAMACGIPVITSNVSSLPEVVADAAITVDPTDHAGLAGAMERVLEDPSLQEDLTAKGFERVKFFDWRKTAAEVLRILTEAGNLR